MSFEVIFVVSCNMVALLKCYRMFCIVKNLNKGGGRFLVGDRLYSMVFSKLRHIFHGAII